MNQIGLTYNNQIILREYGEEISRCFGRDVRVLEGPSFWERVCSYFPSSQVVGYKAGEHLAVTYGAQWSNTTIDFVVRRFFQQEAQQISYFSLDGIKSLVFGATQQTFAETLKLSLTPKALPYIAFFAGTVSSIALPTLVCMISLAYQNVMSNRKSQDFQLISKLPLNQLFSVDPATGRLRNALGHVMTLKDMEDIFVVAAKYNLIVRLIDLCHEIDRKDGNHPAFWQQAEEMFKALLDSHAFVREDGQKMYPNGTLYTQEDEEIIKKAVEDLARCNPAYEKENIQRCIAKLAKGSIFPLGTFSDEQGHLEVLGSPKRILPLFSGEGADWKNAIMRAEDGKYVIMKDTAEKERGALISAQEMAGIFSELQAVKSKKMMLSELTQNQNLLEQGTVIHLPHSPSLTS